MASASSLPVQMRQVAALAAEAIKEIDVTAPNAEELLKNYWLANYPTKVANIHQPLGPAWLHFKEKAGL